MKIWDSVYKWHLANSTQNWTKRSFVRTTQQARFTFTKLIIYSVESIQFCKFSPWMQNNFNRYIFKMLQWRCSITKIPPPPLPTWVFHYKSSLHMFNILVLTKKHSVHNGQDWCPQIKCKENTFNKTTKPPRELNSPQINYNA